VRTKNGYIIKVDKKTVIFDMGYAEQYVDMETTRYGFPCEEEIANHNKQPIELIEDKDIVEIELSEEFVEKKDKKKLIQIGDVYTKETLQRDIDNGIITRILTILSYNQYMANCYKVGGEEC
jgi:hypothetical protein